MTNKHRPKTKTALEKLDNPPDVGTIKRKLSRKQIYEDVTCHKKAPSFLELVGSGAGKATVEEVKKMLDEMRAEDDDS